MSVSRQGEWIGGVTVSPATGRALGSIPRRRRGFCRKSAGMGSRESDALTYVEADDLLERIQSSAADDRRTGE